MADLTYGPSCLGLIGSVVKAEDFFFFLVPSVLFFGKALINLNLIINLIYRTSEQSDLCVFLENILPGMLYDSDQQLLVG